MTVSRITNIVNSRLAAWWNSGRDVRVPNESSASWVLLIRDDLQQLTHSDEAFISGKTNLTSWRPLKAFSPRMVKTGPTPLLRQLCERPLKAICTLR